MLPDHAIYLAESKAITGRRLAGAGQPGPQGPAPGGAPPLLRTALVALGLLVVAAGAARLVQRQVDAARAARWPAPGQLVAAGVLRLHVHCMGAGGPTMVLEAGMGGWSQDWSLVQARLATQGRVCSYDRAGYGWSGDGAATRDGRAMVEQLRQALAAAHVDGPYLLAGHSMGGLLVGLYARSHPREVAGLAFVDAVGRDYAAQFPPQAYRDFRAGLGRLLAVADTLAPLGLPQALGQPASLVAARLPADVRDCAVDFSQRPRQYTALRAENAGFDAMLAQARQAGPLPRVPTVVLSSSVMRDFPPGLESSAMRVAWQLNQDSIAREAGVRRVIFSDTGHFLHVERPDAVVAVLAAWRQQVRVANGKQ
ncbi:alpha/beta hydrolase [Duganella sp. LX20W]|uniref:Alpha/beta hydrolase n=1 Tax=Rugamonas brunnea TaxID=2758569 RepID=A0A7W2I9T5_9BURK|nr:alpha/beta hydrolase [Rugamonas brunnea]MBA5635474.1 alpha/beta hydrolase [Rugamonas brunnea]